MSTMSFMKYQLIKQPQSLIPPDAGIRTWRNIYLKGKRLLRRCEAGKFGAALATLKIESFGPFLGTAEDAVFVIENQSTQKMLDRNV